MILRTLGATLRPVSALFTPFAVHHSRPDRGAARIPRKRITVRRDVPYTEAGTPPLLADLYQPVGPGPWPAVLMVHGGAWRSGERSQTSGQAARVAARGYVVLNATYSLFPHARFPAPVKDLQQAVRWLRLHAGELSVDPARIGAWGYSAGAHLAAMLASLRPGDRLYAEDATPRVLIAGGTPADLRKFRGGTLVPDFLGERWSEGSVVFEESSPAARVSPGHPPTFLYHGGADLLVPADQADGYRSALADAGIPHEYYRMRGLGHITAFLLDHTALQRGVDFLDRHLRDAPVS